jgi:2-oxoacid:acceptor oxidoreductase gamma subunit (pyruvate/2-ketoisovalerate family)
MVEIRIHGRGGQGVVVASKLLSLSLFEKGVWVLSFPTFGAERRGAPVAAFVRVDQKPIHLRCSIETPDVILLLDSTLLKEADPLAGLKPGGILVVNSTHLPSLEGELNCYWVDAFAVALRMGLGSVNHPVVNTTMIGAFAGATGLVEMEHVRKAFERFLGDQYGKNLEAALYACRKVESC